MKIKICNYSDDVHFIELSKSANALELEEAFKGDVNVKCKMDKTHSQIVLFCELEFTYNCDCDRCTVNYNTKLENKFELVYLFSEKLSEEVDEEDLNVHYINRDTDFIDISEEVREYCILAIPYKNLCTEECKGLCYKCGTDLNETKCKCEDEKIDPKWEALLKLKDKLN